MWDLYFQQSDPFLVFFISLIVIVNQRDQILLMKGSSSKEELVSFLVNMPFNIEVDDVLDFCSLTQYFSVKTPASFKRDLLQGLFGAQSGTTEGSVISQARCLPVPVNELNENASIQNPHPEAVRFFLVDCRPAEQYNSGHRVSSRQQSDAAGTGSVSDGRPARPSYASGEHLRFLGIGMRLGAIVVGRVSASLLLQSGVMRFVSNMVYSSESW
uniref:Rhodanese domain-containing protein n=1 Tax=Anopheles atroparvus TaxID=41427 RepID=A0A182J8W0_ANOAO